MWSSVGRVMPWSGLSGAWSGWQTKQVSSFQHHVDSRLQQWCLGVRNRFGPVYEVEMLMVELASHCRESLTHYQAQDMLNTSTYDYERGTR